MRNKTVTVTGPRTGIVIRDELDARKWSHRDLARAMGVPVKAVHTLVLDDARITRVLAEKLGAAFGVSPTFFLNVQVACDSLVGVGTNAKRPT